MSEHLRHLARHAQVGVSCMPNAGLPVLHGPTGFLPAHAASSSPTPRHVRPRGTASASSAGAAARRRSTCRLVVERVGGREVVSRRHNDPGGVVDSTSTSRSGRTRRTSPSVSARTPTYSGVPARPCSRAALERLRAHREGPDRDGAHLLTCVDSFGVDGVGRDVQIVGRFATASTIPLVIARPSPRSWRPRSDDGGRWSNQLG